MYSLHLSSAGLESFRNLMSTTFESYCRIDQMPKPALSVRYARTGGYRSMPEENPLKTWYQKCSIKGAASGPLAGKRIAIKNNVCVAGVQMMNGSVVLDGYVPDDAGEQERRRRDCAPCRSCL
jgi:amidase